MAPSRHWTLFLRSLKARFANTSDAPRSHKAAALMNGTRCERIDRVRRVNFNAHYAPFEGRSSDRVGDKRVHLRSSGCVTGKTVRFAKSGVPRYLKRSEDV